MEPDEFKKGRIKVREQLLQKILDTFKLLNPFSIHLFGSGAKGFKDEFSDLDIWVTFKDNDIEKVLRQLSHIFKAIAPIVIKHHSKSWSPVCGSATSIIHDTEFGPFVVDYYISKDSEPVIKVNKGVHDSHTIRKDINLLLNLIFISIKGIIRKWESDDFINTLRTVHGDFRKRYAGKIKRRQISLSFKSGYRLLSDLYPVANKNQKRAIYKIRKYAKQVEALYT